MARTNFFACPDCEEELIVRINLHATVLIARDGQARAQYLGSNEPDDHYIEFDCVNGCEVAESLLSDKLMSDIGEWLTERLDNVLTAHALPALNSSFEDSALSEP